MHTLATGMPGTRFRPSQGEDVRQTSGNESGLQTTDSTFIDMSGQTDYLAVIDEIRFNGVVAADAIPDPLKVTVTVGHPDTSASDDVTLLFEMPSRSGNATVIDEVWNLRGSWVINPGETLKAKAETTDQVSMTVRWRKMTVLDAASRGYYPSETFAVGSTAAIAAGTPQNLVTGVANKSIEIVAFAITGHGFSETLGSFGIQFTDGSNDYPIFESITEGANSVYNANAFVGKCNIRGPAGASLEATATATMDQGNAACVVIYRLVDDHYTYNPTGTIGTKTNTTDDARYFWFNSTSTGILALDNLLATADESQDMVLEVDGYAFSGSSAALGTMSMGHDKNEIGVSSQTLHGDPAVFFDNDLGSAAGGAASRILVRDDAKMKMQAERQPSFYRVSLGSFTDASMLCWGRLRSGKDAINADKKT